MNETSKTGHAQVEAPSTAESATTRGATLGFDPENTVVLIDGSGYVFRAYYAIRRLSTNDGRPTNAVFGFTQMLLKTLKDLSPRYLAIAFDPGGKNFRHEMYPAYKANRPPAPADLPPQFPLIHQVVDAFQIARISVPGFEADDAIASLARSVRAEGKKVLIVTGDKDFMQLVDDDLSLLDELRMQRGGDGATLIGREQVIAKFGVPPERVVDVLSLCGDSADNVPGVKGIGEKTAAELVNTYGDLEAILAAAPLLKQKARRERLLGEAEMARLSHRLVTIDQDVPVPLSLRDLRYLGPDRGRLRELFMDLEFKRLQQDPIVQGAAAASHIGQETTGTSSTPSVSGDGPHELPIEPTAYRLITTTHELSGLAGDLRDAVKIAIRVEAARADALVGKLTGISLCWGQQQGAYIPLGHSDNDEVPQLGLDEVQDFLAPILCDVEKSVISYGAKEVLMAFAGAGFPLPRIVGDPLLADYLLDVDEGSHGLTELARRHLHHAAIERQAVVGKGKAEVALSTLSPKKAMPYSVEQAEIAFRLDEMLRKRVDERGMGELYRELEIPLSYVLASLERAGVRIDSEHLHALGAEFDVELRRLEEAAYRSAGESFNLGSPQQIAEILFDKLQLPVLKKTKTGASTDASVLEELAGKHELPGLILEHRQLAKLKNTYVDVLPTLVHPITGRVHSTFNQAVAATGRLSSQDPNLQNIPIRTALGRRIREAFVAPAGFVIASLDYSQIELRILAHVTKDPVLIDTFQNDEDVHARTASEIFDVPLHDVTREQRTAAKSINFGLLYGMGVLRLARELGISRRDAKTYLDKYFERYHGVRGWHHAALEQAKEQGEVRTLFGRRRLLPQLSSSNRGEVARAERLVTNTPIQGTAADIIKRAMIVADAELHRTFPQAKIILQVHDELVLEVPAEQADGACRIVRTAMESAAQLCVPLKVDAHWASNWADAH